MVSELITLHKVLTDRLFLLSMTVLKLALWTNDYTPQKQ